MPSRPLSVACPGPKKMPQTANGRKLEEPVFCREICGNLGVGEDTGISGNMSGKEKIFEYYYYY